MRWPNAKVIAYELGRDARNAIAEMADVNGVADQVTVLAECGFGDLFGKRALVICDIEGCEAELLIHRHALDGLADADFIIETHDLFRPGVCEMLRDQFSKTHVVTTINSVPDEQRPSLWHLPELSGLSIQRQAHVLAERRAAPMQWLVCESKRPFPNRVETLNRTPKAA